MSEQTAVVSKRRRIPAIWFVPIVAGLLGIWMVVYTAMNEGPTVEIRFETAEGIEAGKTKVKSLSVQLGLVEEVRINEDLSSVTVVAKLDKKAEALLRDGTRFWVVRPRLGAGGISGLGTIMSGGYIELQPGPGEPADKLEYVGLEDIPLTPVDAPGLWLTLIGKRVGSLGVGQPVLFRGYPVGKVEERRFDPQLQRITYRIFIEEPYAMLVDRNTLFWNASGIQMSASATGLEVDVGSLQTLLAGGVSFEIPEGFERGGRPENGTEFQLFDSKADTEKVTYQYSLPVIVNFLQSVRGLSPGAPVEYRGIKVGSVKRVLTGEIGPEGKTSTEGIPVLIGIEPARLGQTDDEAGVERIRQTIVDNIRAGLRATLETGSLITGSLYVGVDFFPDEEPEEPGTFEQYMTLPTIATGMEGISRQVSSVLTKVNDLPIERTVNELNRTIAEARKLLASQEVEQIPASVNDSLAELDRTLQSLAPGSPVYDQLDRALTELTHALQGIEGVTRTLNEQPNAVIFDKAVAPDPEPGR